MADRLNCIVAEITMGSREDLHTLAGANSQPEYRRTHKRWVVTVLAIYGALVFIGVIATVAHRSMLSQSSHPALEASLEKGPR